MGGKSDKVETKQENDPWAPAQGALKNILGQAGQLYSKGVQYAPFNTVNPFSSQTEQALTGMESLANSGRTGSLVQGGQASLQDMMGGTGNYANLGATARGEFLNNNPYLSSMFSAMSGDVQNAVNSQFSTSGRTGSPAHSGTMTQQLGNLASQIYGQNYAQERQNQLAAQGQLGNMAMNGVNAIGGLNNLQYADMNALAGVGAAREGKAGETLQDMLNRWNFDQNAPWDNLNRYAALAQGIGGMGGTQTGEQKTTMSTLSSLTSLLAAGAGVAKAANGGG
jgi:hypothetical protein